MINKFQKSISVLLILTILVLSPYLEYKKAEAFIPIILGATLMESYAATLVGAGAIFVTQYALMEAVDWCYSDTPEHIKDALNTAVANSSNGVVSITDEVWAYIKGWVDSHFGPEGGTADYTKENPYAVPGAPQTTVYVSNTNSLTVNGDYYQIVYIGYYQSNSTKFIIYKNGVFFENSIISKNAPPFNYTYQTDARPSIASYNGQYYLTFKWLPSGFQDFGTGIPLGTNINISLPQTLTYSGTPKIDDPTWDIKPAGATSRNVQLQPVADLVNKTYEDIVVVPTAAPEPTIFPASGGTWSRTGDNSGVYGFPAGRTWDGTYNPTAGQWDWEARPIPAPTTYPLADGIWTLTGETTGTYTVPDAVPVPRAWDATWADSVGWTWVESTSIPLPAEGELDFSPLIYAGDLFTKKFPFSIPWDIKAQLINFNVTPTPWKFDIPFNFSIAGFTVDKVWTWDFTSIDYIMQVFRWLEVVGLSVGLMAAFRKWVPE